MSVVFELYEYDDSMDDDVLRSMGVKGGLLGQMTNDAPSEERAELLQDTPSKTVGENLREFPERVNESIRGVQTVDETLLSTIETAAEEYGSEEDDVDAVLNWLRERKGNKVFLKAK